MEEALRKSIRVVCLNSALTLLIMLKCFGAAGCSAQWLRFTVPMGNPRSSSCPAWPKLLGLPAGANNLSPALYAFTLTKVDDVMPNLCAMIRCFTHSSQKTLEAIVMCDRQMADLTNKLVLRLSSDGGSLARTLKNSEKMAVMFKEQVKLDLNLVSELSDTSAMQCTFASQRFDSTLEALRLIVLRLSEMIDFLVRACLEDGQRSWALSVLEAGTEFFSADGIWGHVVRLFCAARSSLGRTSFRSASSWSFSPASENTFTPLTTRAAPGGPPSRFVSDQEAQAR